MGRLLEFQAGNGIPVPVAALGAAQYAAKMGNRRLVDYSNVRTDPGIQKAAADAYLALPSHQAHAVPAFKAMREETSRQFDFMTRPKIRGGLGISVGVTDHDPYVTQTGAPNSRAMMRDVHENRQIKVLSTASTGEHPFFTNDQNDQFRAVHDFFGHAATGRNFDQHGEEAAWLSHSAMFSPLARRAMATETRGQNSVNNAYPDRMFGEQKVGLIPATFADPRNSVPGRLAQSRHTAFAGRQFL